MSIRRLYKSTQGAARPIVWTLQIGHYEFKFFAIQSNMSCLISKSSTTTIIKPINNQLQLSARESTGATGRAWENVPKQLMGDLAPKRPWTAATSEASAIYY